MKIAIVAPSPVPFGVGGAEKLWWGLLEHLNKHTSHSAELIKLPTVESDFFSLIDSYEKFYRLDLSHFDMVISGKYPGWMVKHKNHHIYMLHTLRGLYDTYPFQDKEIEEKDEAVSEILDRIEREDEDLDEFFKLLSSLKDRNLNEELFSFPGEFIKRIVRHLDKIAMKGVKSFSAISETVAKRRDYFPKNAKVSVNYPPSNLSEFKNSSYEYFFTASRLDHPKRIQDIIKAYKKVKTDIPLKIAGEGPMKEELLKLAEDDKRIEFLGFVSDDELIDLYSRAYAVIFVPYMEDYGLITIEAMNSGKCVITYDDSGGVTEFVRDFQTGFVAKGGDIEDLADKIELLSEDPELARKMGERAKESVRDISWQKCVSLLLNPKKRKKITVLSTYPIYPPRGGGQNRIFYLYKEIAKDFDVEIISIANSTSEGFYKEIAPGLYERRIPKTQKLAKAEGELEKFCKVAVTDVVMIENFDKIPALKEAFLKSERDSFAVVTNHPYFYPFLKKYASKPIVHESHNFEYLLKKEMFDKNEKSEKFLEKIFQTEKEATIESFMTVFCSEEDEKLMSRYFEAKPKRSLFLPNGVDLKSVPFTDPLKREEKKRRLGLDGVKIALFIGSWHKPNIDAVYEIFKMAEVLKEVKFLILGSAGLFFGGKEKPDNVGFAGIVSDEEKALTLSVADVALNPMKTGSGTNLKMLDYMAAGVRVLTSPVGARGLNIPSGLVKISEIGDFYKYIEDIENYTDVYKAREFVEKNYSWEVIGKKAREFYAKTFK